MLLFLPASRAFLRKPIELGGFEDSPTREAEVEVLLIEAVSLMMEFLFKNGLAACRGGVVGLNELLVWCLPGDILLLGKALPVLSMDVCGLWRGVEIGVTEAVE